MNIEGAKELQNILKLTLNEISKGRFKSKEQKIALENIKLLYDSQKAAIKLFNEYSSIASETKHKVKYGKGPKILSPEQVLQRLPIALAQEKAGNTSENLKSDKLYILFIEKKKLLKKYTTI